jgi:hypothetical protein
VYKASLFEVSFLNLEATMMINAPMTPKTEVSLAFNFAL